MSHNHLRRYRKRGAFTQSEIAFLLGIECGTKVSRFECRRRTPNLPTAFAYQIIFDVSACELFPGLYKEAAGFVAGRVDELSQKLAAQPDHPITHIKLEMLKSVATQTNGMSPPVYGQQQS